MKNRARIVSGLAALAALFLAPIAEASLSRSSTPAIETPASTLTTPAAAPEPSGFSLFEGTELAPAAAEPSSAPSFHTLAAVSLFSNDGADAPLVSVDELIYPKTRYRVFELLGSRTVGVERGVSLELHWRSAHFSCGFASGTVGWLSQDPLGDVDSPNLYSFVGMRPHEKTDPQGLAGGPIGRSYGIAVSEAFSPSNSPGQRIGFGTLGLLAAPAAGAESLVTGFFGTAADAQTEVEEFAVQRLGVNRASIEFLELYFVANPNELGLAMSSLRAGAAQATSKIGEILQRARQARAEAIATGGMAHPERGALVLGGGRTGRPVPKPTVERVNSRLPRNYRYAGEEYPKLPDELAAKYPGVGFTEKGFVDLNPYAKARVRLSGLTGEYAGDAAKANKVMGFQSTPQGYTWHHVEDTETLLLVPQDLHDAIAHTGGAAKLRAAREP